MQKKTSGKKDDNAETEKNSRKEEEFSESMKEPSQKDNPREAEAFFESIVRGSEGCLWMTIEELMTRDLVTVNEDAPVEEVFSLFAKNPYHTLPVVNKKGELAGVIDLDIVLEILL